VNAQRQHAMIVGASDWHSSGGMESRAKRRHDQNTI
jgi:hypothetical protein